MTNTMSAVATTDPATALRRAMAPDAEIEVVHHRGIVLIHFVGSADNEPLVLDPRLAGMTLAAIAQHLPKRRLPEGFSLGMAGWAAVCVLAQLKLGGAVTMRAVEQNQRLSIPHAQATLLGFVAALNARSSVVDPFLLGQALNTCIFHLGNSADDLYSIMQPLRRASEVSGLLVAT